MRVALPSVLEAASLEDAVSSAADLSLPLTLDMGAVEWVDVPALIYLLSLVAQRVSSGIDVRIVIPSSKNIRDLMRRWEFPQAVSRACGRPFHQLVTPEALKYFGESPTHYRLERPVMNPITGIMERLEYLRFFGFQTFVLDERTSTQLIDTECARWNNPLVLQVLTHHFATHAEEFSRVVIYEALANTLQHPGATVVCTASRAHTSSATDKPQHLTICCWDNGMSIIETLASCLRNGNPIRVPTPSLGASTMGLRFHLKYLDDHGETVTRVEQASWTPTGSASESDILFASLLPGITRKASVSVASVPLPAALQGHADTGPGMGLFVLLRTVVDELKGTLALRTGRYFMNIKRSPPAAPNQYNVKVACRAMPFYGNMLTMRLPL